MEKGTNRPHISINEKNLQNFDLKKLASLAQIIKLLVWLAKFMKAYMIVTLWVSGCPQFDSKGAILKYCTSNFEDFSDNQ